MKYEDVDWDRASCREVGVDPFYAEYRNDPYALGLVKRVCSSCPIVFDCLNYALDHEPWGIWGGLTASERSRRGGLIADAP